MEGIVGYFTLLLYKRRRVDMFPPPLHYMRGIVVMLFPPPLDEGWKGQLDILPSCFRR